MAVMQRRGLDPDDGRSVHLMRKLVSNAVMSGLRLVDADDLAKFRNLTESHRTARPSH